MENVGEREAVVLQHLQCLVGSIESFTLEPDLHLQARSDRIVLGVL